MIRGVIDSYEDAGTCLITSVPTVIAPDEGGGHAVSASVPRWLPKL